jgi:hypothetical protein
MMPNPICYNFIFARSAVTIDQLTKALSVPGSPVETITGDWERKLLGVAGFLVFPEEESILVLKSRDRRAIEAIRDAGSEVDRFFAASGGTP